MQLIQALFQTFISMTYYEKIILPVSFAMTGLQFQILNYLNLKQ